MIGTVVCSTRVKALSGTWFPLGKTNEDAEVVEPNAAFDAALEEEVAEPLDPVDELGAPRLLELAAPPETIPVDPPEDPVEERIYK